MVPEVRENRGDRHDFQKGEYEDNDEGEKHDSTNMQCMDDNGKGL